MFIIKVRRLVIIKCYILRKKFINSVIVSRGELYYKKVLESGILDLSDDNHDFEELLYVAEEALELRGVQI